MTNVAASARALAVPLHYRAYRRLWGSQLLSEIGDWAARLALTALVFDRTDSALLAGAAYAASLLPWLGPGQLLATLADRHGRRVVMVLADLIRAAIFLLVCIPMPTPLLLTLTVLAGLAAPPFAAARSAAVLEVVPKEVLPGGLALTHITGEVAIVAGNLGAGILLAVVGPVPALALNAVTFLASAALLRGLPPLVPTGAAKGAGRQLKAGINSLITDPPTMLVATVATACAAAATAVESLTVPYAANVAPTARWLPGAILAGVSVVGVVGLLLCPLNGAPDQLLRATVVMSVISSALCMGLLTTPLPSFRIAGMVATGLMYVPCVIANVLVSPRLHAGSRASSIAVLMGVLAGAQAACALIAGVLAEATSPQSAAAAVVMVSVLCSLACAASMRGPMHMLRSEAAALAHLPSQGDEPVDIEPTRTIPDMRAVDHSDEVRVEQSGASARGSR